MRYLTLIFPTALIGFLLLIYSEYVPLLARRDLLPLSAPSAEDHRFGRRDAPALGILCLLYGITAFLGLGVNTAPQNFCRFQERGQYALIELDEPTEIGSMMYYTGLYTGDYRLQFSADGEHWIEQTSMGQSYADLFKWCFAELAPENGPVKYLRITAGSRLWLGEVALFDAAGVQIENSTLHYPSGCARLFDEPETVPAVPDFRNSAYFDEIYHARTAFENVQGIYPYEVSHPPLGKLLISLGIRLFGMTPFGWRFVGTSVGILMLPVLYLLLKKLFGGVAVPICCTAIFAFDFMHFVQTRIATIDTYGVFFTLLMYLFFYRYLCDDRSQRRAWLPDLALAGLSFGLGAACKWTCLYAGAGLGVLWLADRIARGVRLCGKNAAMTDPADTAGRREALRAYRRETAENVLWCLLFFVAVPCAVYYASYYPYGRASGLSGISMYFTKDYLDIVLENQKFMFTYHAGVTATHPYSSHWYEWLLDVRPILYYLNYFGDGTKSSFGAFTGPLLCWGGLLAMLCMLYLSIGKRDQRALFILIGYLAQLLPWVPIPRVTFAYHYFPSTVFLVLALGHVFSTVQRGSKHWRAVLLSFTAAGLVLFVVFYPVLSGVRVSAEYCTKFLAWIPGRWPF